MLFLFFMPGPPPTPTLFPYTTLFRSVATRWCCPMYPTPLRRALEPCSGARRRGYTVPKPGEAGSDRKSTRLNSSHQIISYAVFCLKKKKRKQKIKKEPTRIEKNE